eukprot:c10767_g1_i1.p2 GENE.c10767_g1_i1~~c10767_g1_i1.p2  ORF type:complete len:204 (+),score=63.57 c10767_g1_i1:886-1497(+)
MRGASVQTISPAMDIQVAYNLERLLFYASNGNTDVVRQAMTQLETVGTASITLNDKAVGASVMQHIQSVFVSCTVTDDNTAVVMKQLHDNHNFFICPHSAIGVHAARTVAKDVKKPVVCVLTANPAKFQSTVESITEASLSIPPAVARLSTLPTKYKELHKDTHNDDDGGGQSNNADAWQTRWANILKSDVERVTQAHRNSHQ